MSKIEEQWKKTPQDRMPFHITTEDGKPRVVVDPVSYPVAYPNRGQLKFRAINKTYTIQARVCAGEKADAIRLLTELREVIDKL